MNLTVKRTTFTKTSTIGELSIDGVFFCYTIERPSLVLGTPETLLGPDGKNHPCIPVGTYKTILGHDARLGYDVYVLQDVPGRSSILIHAANWASQLLGCIAVGEKAVADAVENSRMALDALMKKCQGQDVVVTVVEA